MRFVSPTDGPFVELVRGDGDVVQTRCARVSGGIVLKTEAMKDITVVGEGFIILKLTGGGTGSIVYVDVAQLSYLR